MLEMEAMKSQKVPCFLNLKKALRLRLCKIKEIFKMQLLWLNLKNWIIRKNFQNFKAEFYIMKKWRTTNITDICLNQNLKLPILQLEKFKKSWKQEPMFHFIWNVESLNWDLEKFIQRDQEENRFRKFQTLLVSVVQLFIKSSKII